MISACHVAGVISVAYHALIRYRTRSSAAVNPASACCHAHETKNAPADLLLTSSALASASSSSLNAACRRCLANGLWYYWHRRLPIDRRLVSAASPDNVMVCGDTRASSGVWLRKPSGGSADHCRRCPFACLRCRIRDHRFPHCASIISAGRPLCSQNQCHHGRAFANRYWFAVRYP